MSLPMRIVAGFVLTIALLWAMIIWMPQYLSIGGGIPGLIVLGALLTLMNMFVRPIIGIIAFPAKLIATLIVIILCNLLFLWLLQKFSLQLDPRIASFQIHSGFDGWLIVSTVLGIGHWVLKHIIHSAKE